MPTDAPLKHLNKIANKIGMSEDVKGLAIKILRRAKQQKITQGKDPRGLAAAILYTACKLQNKKITQKEIAKAANVTEVTIRNRKKELMKKLNLN